MRRCLCLLCALQIIIALLVVGCGSVGQQPAQDPERAAEQNTAEEGGPGLDLNISLSLPGSNPEEEGPVTRAIYSRRSQRNFSQEPLSLESVTTLLWSAGGLSVDAITGPTRTIPSAGATYPLDVYLAASAVEGLEPGIYRYDHLEHGLQPVLSGDRVGAIAGAALNQQFIAEAPAVIALVAHFERTTGRYGERGERYVYMDAGYASQNIYLLAGELGLVTVAVGAFDDGDMAEVLGTGGLPLLVMPVGLPAP